MMAAPADLGILTADAALVVQSWNHWLEVATGIAADAARGQRLDQLLPDLERRGLLRLLHETLTAGTVRILAPAFHHYVIPCAPRSPSRHFERMQQRATIAPLQEGEHVTGLMLWIEDVTPQLDAERDLAEALVSSDAERRRAAADAIAAAGPIASLESFESALESADWRIRADAVQGLSRVADGELLLSVVETLRREHRNFNALSSALKLLTLSDARLTSPLTELLSDADADLRIQAALALGEQHDDAAVDPLIGALDDPDVNVRFHAIEALGRLRAPAAVDALAALAQGGDFFLAFPALEALTLIGDARVATQLLPLLRDQMMCDPVARALGAFGGEEAVAALTAVPDNNPEAVAVVVEALVAIERRYQRDRRDGSRIVDLFRASITVEGRTRLLAELAEGSTESSATLVTVLGWLRGDDVVRALAAQLDRPETREAVVDALVQSGERAVDAIVACLPAADQDTSRAAIAALGRIGSPRATSALVALLGAGRDADTIVAVNRALAQIRDPAAIEPLLSRIGDHDVAIRHSTVAALTSTGYDPLAPRLAALLVADDPVVRESAVRLAGHFGNARDTDALFARLSDEAEAVRAAVLEQLPTFADPRVPAVLIAALAGGAPRTRAAAARALGRVTAGGAGAALIQALADADVWVRYYAARGLGQLQDADGLPALSALVAGDAAPHVRIAALDAIGAVGAAESVPLLAGAATDADPDVAGAALRALGLSGTPAALPMLIDAVRHTDPERCRVAIAALADHGSAGAVDGLQWAAAADRTVATKAAAIAALGVIAAGGETPAADAAIDALLALFADPDARDDAISIAAQLPAPRLAAIARGLRNPQVAVRRGVVEALGRLGDPAAIDLIAEVLDDPSPLVREDAVRELARHGPRDLGRRFEELARHDPAKSVRRAAATALARQRPST